MRSLHEVHGENVLWASHVFSSARLFQGENYGMANNEIRWVLRYFGLPPNRGTECRGSSSNKIADKKKSEKGPKLGSLRCPKSESCPNLKRWLDVCHGYHRNQAKVLQFLLWLA
jgi:hypothetical protein